MFNLIKFIIKIFNCLIYCQLLIYEVSLSIINFQLINFLLLTIFRDICLVSLLAHSGTKAADAEDYAEIKTGQHR